MYVSVCGCTYEFVTTECNIVVNQTKRNHSFYSGDFTVKGYTAVFMWYCTASVDLLMLLQ